MPSLDFDFDADDEEEGFDFEDEGLLLDEGRPFEVEVEGLFLLVLLPPPSRRLFEGTGAFFLFLETSKSKYSICTAGLFASFNHKIGKFAKHNFSGEQEN